ncbi:PA domain-containing protein [Stackebrandtia endophytica]|uniref:PA domain-containing protein n=1 Tax=Stackebrandtia endophytica TaxID=1496996 RepID=A0A543AS54_9ACTN|nr:S8 family serine peptidase [Stackebrandtia endophytica]TQL75414.1 PA domain-containing protein [Stackebrandtia endophytica]
MSSTPAHPGGRRRRGGLLPLLAVPLLTASLIAVSSPANADEVPTIAELPAVGPGQQIVTLITGDRVLLEPGQDGRQVAVVEPGDRASGLEPSFEVVEDGDDLYVVPADAAALIPDRLDPELFNVTKLVEYQYLDGVPVIVTDAPSFSVAATRDGLAQLDSLSSIDGYAATIEADGGWWPQMTATTDFVTTSSRSSEKVWLDELLDITLDESVPMIGAPEAWEEGYDGTGTTVAVLDTGIDEDHPDLVGQIVDTKNFTTEPDTTDGHGHGTHVAGTIAGTGAGSDGAYTGVAPGADLLIGKICTSSGTCPNSGTIAAMEWAAPIADVISMSIGSSAGDDGTAPTAVAVNNLTAQHDALFVIAAGNSGRQGPGTVGSPGSADAALTVGAVNKSGVLADFSSYGPRLGDFAIKPDVTAPGVSIVAPRGAGTSMGTPVDDLYTSANGTSMATPHVAGAAAIALQASPDLTAPQLKSSLVNTAVPAPDVSVYQQGGGLVNIPAAIHGGGLVAPAPMNLGFFGYPQTDLEPVEREVTYTNRTDQPIEVDLTLELTDEAGTAIPDSAVSVEPSGLTVPAGDTATATVTLDPQGLALGGYGGFLTASHADGAERSPVGFHLEKEMYEIVINGIARDGRPAFGNSSVYIADAYDTAKLALQVRFDNGVARLRVPPGAYYVGGTINTYDGNNATPQDRVMVGEPTVEVTGDVELTFDARLAEEITVDTPDHPDSSPHYNQSRQMLRFIAEDNGTYGATYIGPWTQTFALESGSVEVGSFEFVTNPRLTAPHLALSVTAPTESDLYARQLSGPPPLNEELNLPLVYVGDGTEADYEGLDVTGAAVLTSRTGPTLPQKEAVARANGAAALLVMNNADGWFTGSVGSEAELPSMSVSGEDGEALREQLADGEVTVRVAGTTDSPYLYDLVLPEPDAFPSGGDYVANTADLAVVDNSFHGVPGHVMGEYRAMWRPGQIYGAAQYTQTPAATARVEYVSPGDSLYRQTLTAAWTTVGTLMERDTTYQVGDEVDRSWFRSPMRSGILDRYGARNPGDPVTRTGNAIKFVLPEWFDNGSPAAYGVYHASVDTVAFRAYQDGELFGEAPRPRITATVGPAEAEYRFEVDLARNADWWPTSTEVHTAWTFTSDRPQTDETETLPLLQATYDTDLDLTNTAPHPRDRNGPATFDVSVSHQSGVEGIDIAGAKVWISYDDGVTWQKRPVKDLGDGDFRAILDSPDPEDTETGFASVRVEAWDADGNRIEQEVIRAWQLAER